MRINHFRGVHKEGVIMSNLKKLNNAVLALILTIIVLIVDMKRIIPMNLASLGFAIGAYVYCLIGIIAYNNKERIREVGTKRLKKFGYYFFESVFLGIGAFGIYTNLPGYHARGSYVCLAIIAFIYVMTLIYRYGFMITERKEIKKYSILTAVMLAMHECVYIFPANDTRPGKVTGAIFILVIGLITALYFFDFDKIKPLKNYKERRPEKYTHIMYFFAIWLIFATLETLSKTFVFQVMPWNWVMNMLWIFLVSGTIYLVSKKMKLALLITLAIWVVFGLANGFLILFRGSPILPADLYLIKTASEVSSNYSYELSYFMMEGLCIAMFTVDFILKLRPETPSKKNYKRFVGVFVGAIVLTYPLLLLNAKLFDDSLDLWRPVKTYRQFGALNGFSLNLLAMQVEQPEGYSIESAQEVLKDYESDEVDTTRTPNIIVVMCESFSDLTKVGDYETNKEVLPYLNSLKENTIKGYAYASVLGGTTANSEYEFQTGNATTFLPTGTVPYQQYIQGQTFSFTSTLKSLGYYAQAMHAYQRNTYRREIVYPLLGFDHYQAMESFDNPEKLRNYITDGEDFRKIIELYENRDKTKPFYLYNVTMQNHSSYDTKNMEYNIHVTSGSGYDDADEYLSCVSRTDEDLRILIDYFSKVEEETYIVFFGDHQPNLYSGFFEEILGGEMESLSVEDLQKRYVVPFFIWSNKYLESKTVDAMSLNYLSSFFLQEAKLPMTAYNKYLMDLYKEYPVINLNGYIDKEGKYYSASEMDENEEIVNYNKLVYNTIIDKYQGLEEKYVLKQLEGNSEEVTTEATSPSPGATGNE